MIQLQLKGVSVRLAWGQSCGEVPECETYRDTAKSGVIAIVEAVERGEPWREAVQRRYGAENPWLTHIVTSPLRDAFLRMHPVPEGGRFLDIGAGWGQLALPLAARGEVVALEPTPERLAFIRAAARQERLERRMVFVQADFFDVAFADTFDAIFCIGVLEWLGKFRGGDPREIQQDFLGRVRRLLKPGGVLIIGIENRVGLKYLLGAPDDHTGVSGVSVLDYALARERWLQRTGQELRSFTHTRVELDEMLQAAGFSGRHFFGAFPDYKLPEKILPLGPEVDRYFVQGGYVAEHDGSCGRPLAFQEDLRSHYRTLGALGVASEFVPSFFVLARP